MNNLVLVTGGDGFLGTNIVRELLDRNYKVRILTEPGRDPVTLAGLDVEVYHGDIRIAEDAKKAVDGCGYVIHTAASTNIWPPRSKFLNEINVLGTQNIIDAAAAAKVERLIHVGSANSFGSGTKELPGDESRPYSGTRYGLGYMDTKYEAHKRVVEAAQNGSVKAIVVAPTFMIGPYDTKPGSGKMILSVAHGDVPGYTDGGRCYIYVKDVAVAVANALTKGTVGESYIVGNENLTYNEAFSLMARVAGVEPPKMKFPALLSLLAGAAGSFFGKLFGFEPKISLPMARISTDYHFYSAAKAVRELGLPQTPVEEAVKEAYAWFVENGYVKGKGQ